MGRNTCKCPSPPGGTVECPDSYMPFCIVKKNQEPRYLCLPPVQGASSRQIINRALSIITGERKSLVSTVSRNDINTLRQESYETDDVSVTFSLSPQVKRALEDIENNKGGRNSGLGMGMEIS